MKTIHGHISLNKNNKIYFALLIELMILLISTYFLIIRWNIFLFIFMLFIICHMIWLSKKISYIKEIYLDFKDKKDKEIIKKLLLQPLEKTKVDKKSKTIMLETQNGLFTKQYIIKHCDIEHCSPNHNMQFDLLVFSPNDKTIIKSDIHSFIPNNR